MEWNKLAPDLRNRTVTALLKNILNLIHHPINSIFNFQNPKTLKFITVLLTGLIHFRYHEFKHNFQDCLNPLCNRGLNNESASLYLLHCPLFAEKRKTFLSNIKSINHKFLEQNNSTLNRLFFRLVHNPV